MDEKQQLMDRLNQEIDALLGTRRQLEQAVETDHPNIYTQGRNLELALEKFECQLNMVMTKAKHFSKTVRRRLATRFN